MRLWVVGSFMGGKALLRRWNTEWSGWPAKVAAWERMMQQWDQLYYWGKCDSVLNPHTGQIAPLSQMGSLRW